MFNVLLLDDSSMDLTILKEIAKTSLPFSKKINAFTSSQEAIKSCEKQHYNLVITDIEMPDINGFDFIEIIKKNDNQTIIAVSGSVADNSANDTILYAANAYGADFAISKVDLFESLNALLCSIYKDKVSNIQQKKC